MTATQPVAEITSIRKGDGHPHLTYGGVDTLCGRTLYENRWATITHGKQRSAASDREL